MDENLRHMQDKIIEQAPQLAKANKKNTPS